MLASSEGEPAARPFSRFNGSSVKLINLVRVVRDHFAPTQLHRRCNVSVFYGEAGVNNAELADRFRARDSLICALDCALKRGLNFRKLCGLGRGTAGQPVLAKPIGEHFGIQGNQSADEGTLIADDNDVRDEGVGCKRILKDFGRNILSTRRDDELFLATSDGELTVA